MNSPKLPATIRARDIMTKKLVTLTPEMDVFDGVRLLLKNRISGAPVVDSDRKLIGVFTEKCCMKVLVDAAYDQVPSNRVEAFMIREFHTITEETDLLSIAQTIWNTGERRLPVLSDGTLVGQVSRRDVMRAANDLIEVAPDRESPLLYLSALMERNESPI